MAEHSFRVGVIGITLAVMEGADVGRAYVTTAVPEAVSAHQVSAMPDAMAEVIQDLVAEYEATQTPELRVAHDADKIETLMQAIEYQAQGYDAAAWRESSVAALRTDSGRQLAQAIGSADPHGWWSAFAASYTELLIWPVTS